MTIDQLIGLLAQMRGELGGDAEVLLGVCRTDPQEYSIRGAATMNDLTDVQFPEVAPYAVLLTEALIGKGDSEAWAVARR